MLATVFPSGALFLVLSLALYGEAFVIHRPSIVGNALFLRQTTPCDSQCAVFQTALDTCTTTSCYCATAVANSLENCVTCAIDTSPTADVINSAEDLVSSYLSICEAAVVSIPGAPQSPSSTSVNRPQAPITASLSASGTTSVGAIPSSNPSVSSAFGSSPSATQDPADPLGGLTTGRSLVTSTIRPDTTTSSAQSQITGGSSGLASMASRHESMTSLTLGLISAVTWIMMF